ncbi:MAG: hypothetical protein ABIE22_01660 [archaeon]
MRGDFPHPPSLNISLTCKSMGQWRVYLKENEDAKEYYIEQDKNCWLASYLVEKAELTEQFGIFRRTPNGSHRAAFLCAKDSLREADNAAYSMALEFALDRVTHLENNKFGREYIVVFENNTKREKRNK